MLSQKTVTAANTSPSPKPGAAESMVTSRQTITAANTLPSAAGSTVTTVTASNTQGAATGNVALNHNHLFTLLRQSPYSVVIKATAILFMISVNCYPYLTNKTRKLMQMSWLEQCFW
jgi:hypothetical protein